MKNKNKENKELLTLKLKKKEEWVFMGNLNKILKENHKYLIYKINYQHIKKMIKDKFSQIEIYLWIKL